MLEPRIGHGRGASVGVRSSRCTAVLFVLGVCVFLGVTACSSEKNAAAPSGPAGPGKVVVEQRGYLVAIPLDGSHHVRLAKLPGDDPAISRAGSRVAFAADSGISIMRIDGSHIRPVTHGDDGSPSWSADGQRLYFVRYFTSHECGSIFSVAVSGGTVGRIGDPSKVVAPGHFHSYQDPAVSPDGTRIAFSDWAGCADAGGFVSPRLRVVDLKGRPTDDLGELARNGFYPDPEHSGPAWSPDGTELAYRHNSDLAVANRDGSDERILIHGGSSIYEAPVWSPDGAWIAFTRGTDSAVNIVEVVHPNGSSRRVIAHANHWPAIAGWLPASSEAHSSGGNG